MDRIEFTKLHSGGNDFILIDLSRYDLSLPLSDFAKRICRRRISVGADGLLAVRPEVNAGFSLRYFNQDGSEARFCGNGLLCVALWIYVQGNRENPIRFCWKDRTHEAWVSEGGVRAKLPPPQNLKLDLSLQSEEVVSYVVLGVPHVVTFQTDLERIDVNRLGRRIRFDPAISTEGANVDFCQPVDRSRIKLRTYERGVEAETLSCGSGAAAASYIAYRKGLVDRAVKVLTPGGEITIHIDRGQMFMEGNPVIVYKGVLEKS